MRSKLAWLVPVALLLLPMAAQGQELPAVGIDASIGPTIAYLLQASPLAALVYGAVMLHGVFKNGICFQVTINPESIRVLATEIVAAVKAQD